MNRLDAILEEIKGRDVLDIGCIDMDGSMHLYKAMKPYVHSLTGIDTQKAIPKENIIKGNFENIKIKKQYNCVVAGEVLEHLNNCGLFLDNIKKILSPLGKLVITTPNSLSLERMVRHFLTGRISQDASNNPGEHTQYFTFEVLERLLMRHGFKIWKKFFVNHEIRNPDFSGSSKPRIAKVVWKSKQFFKNLRPHLRDTILVVAVHKSRKI